MSLALDPSGVALPNPAETLEVSVAQTRALLDAPDRPRLIDCREEDEFAYCHLPDAELVPLATIPARLATLLATKDQPAIVYCHHGMRSMRAVTYLRARGFTHVFSMRGGINAWSDEIDASIPVY